MAASKMKEQSTEPTQGEVFFARIDALARDCKDTIFAVMKYPEANGVPERTLFKILLGKDAQFTAEVAGGNLARQLQESGRVDLLFAGLFTKIAGKITMQQIMHDAVRDPSAIGLGKFRFKPSPGSLYGNNPPIGLNGGKISLYMVTPNSVGIIARDTRENDGIKGVYALDFTDEKRIDSKKREATLVRMIRITDL